MKQGHSNMGNGKDIRPWIDGEERDPNPPARIPIWGGARVESVKELPPLALRQDEWERIGRAMGWLN